MSADILSFIELTLADVDDRLARCKRSWGLGLESTRTLSLEEGLLHFTINNKIITAPIQVVGLFDVRERSFAWGWADKTLPDSLKQHSMAAYQFGLRHGLPIYHQPKVPASSQDAWEFACITACAGHAFVAIAHPHDGKTLYLTMQEPISL